MLGGPRVRGRGNIEGLSGFGRDAKAEPEAAERPQWCSRVVSLHCRAVSDPSYATIRPGGLGTSTGDSTALLNINGLPSLGWDRGHR